MQVVIISGGLGTRLKSLASDIPKALVPVAGRPFVEHQLELLRTQGLKEIVICTGHLGDQIENHLQDGAAFGVSIRYSREDAGALLGTGGALVNALPLLAEEFLVTYGDSYLPTPFGAFMDRCHKSGLPAMMSVYRNAGKWDQSNVRVDGNRVGFYSKKAVSGSCDFIDYGLSYFRKEVIRRYAQIALPLDLAVVHEALVSANELGAYRVEERFYEVGKPEGVAELNGYLSRRVS